MSARRAARAGTKRPTYEDGVPAILSSRFHPEWADESAILALLRDGLLLDWEAAFMARSTGSVGLMRSRALRRFSARVAAGSVDQKPLPTGVTP